MLNFQYILNEGYNKKNIFDYANKSYIYKGKKKYIDLSYGAGTLILGNQSKIFVNSIKKILNKKISIIGTPNQEAVKYSKLLKKLFPRYSKFIFCNTGSEAITKSLRIANAITGKNLIISVTGSWHGSVDKTLFTSNKSLQSFPVSNGLGEFNKKNIKFIPYNDIKKSKKILDKNKKKISCLLIEPIQASLPQLNIEKYLNFLVKYCNKNNIIILFDEMITGIRYKGSSVQQILNLQPDISTFGKCFGGGFPIGIIALTDKLQKKLSQLKKDVFFGGTFSGNQISTFVGRKTVEYIHKNKKKIFDHLEKKGSYIEKEIKKFININNLNANILRCESMLRIIFSKKLPKDRVERDFLEKNKKKTVDNFRNFLLNQGLYYPSNGILFISYQNSKNDVKKIIKSINAALLKFLK
jgi:glutamate-1-semialdehyde 2,1-aminomutase